MSEQNFKDATLWNTDNLEVLRGLNSETVDLVYLDPPFNSNRMYQAAPGTKAEGQSFDDTWSWNSVKEEWLDTIQDDYPAVFEAIEAARDCNRHAMGGYIAFMAVRLIEIHRVLKPTGAMYLHCDPSADSYLKVVCDAVFKHQNFRNEIIWHYSGENLSRRKFRKSHDVILFYAKSAKTPFTRIGQGEHDKNRFRFEDALGKYQLTSCTNNAVRPNMIYPFHGITRQWRFSKTTMEQYEKNGLLVFNDEGIPRRKTYMQDCIPGGALQDVWTDLTGGVSGAEYTGWATQKPVALLERIIKASSNPDDLILDPFCGCATAMVAAQNLERRWIGIDKEHYAIEQVKERLGLWCNFETIPPARTDGDVTDMRSVPVRLQRDPYGWEKFTNAQKRELLADIQAKDNGVQCPGCGIVLPLRYFHLDHDRPKSDPRSSNMIDNRILLCAPCNLAKSNEYTVQGLIQYNARNDLLAPEVDRQLLEKLLVTVNVAIENLKVAYP